MQKINKAELITIDKQEKYKINHAGNFKLEQKYNIQKYKILISYWLNLKIKQSIT